MNLLSTDFEIESLVKKDPSTIPKRGKLKKIRFSMRNYFFEREYQKGRATIIEPPIILPIVAGTIFQKKATTQPGS